MHFTISSQSQLFVFTVCIGFLIGFLYDIFRIFRKTFKHPDFVTQLEDMIFWLLVSFLVFYFMLNQNDGEIRVFSIVGVISGMIVYFIAVSPFIVKISVLIISFVKKIFQTIVQILLIPIKIIMKVLLIPYTVLRNTAKKIKNFAKKNLQKSSRYAKIRKAKAKTDLKILFKKI